MWELISDVCHGIRKGRMESACLSLLSSQQMITARCHNSVGLVQNWTEEASEG